MLSEEQKKKVVDLVFAERGKAVVTIKYCKKRLRFPRKYHRSTIARVLRDAGLKWLARRVKSFVPSEHKVERLEYCDWVLARRQSTLDRYVYTDGTTFYLARGTAEMQDKRGAPPWGSSSGAWPTARIACVDSPAPRQVNTQTRDDMPECM